MPTLFFYSLYVCCTGMVWYGMVWYGMVWYGMVWYGMVWYGMVRKWKTGLRHSFFGHFYAISSFLSTLYMLETRAYHCKNQCQIYISIPGCDINCKNWIGNTPLCIAASHGNKRLIKYLLRKGILDRKLV